MYRMQQYDKYSDRSGDKTNLQEIIKSHLKLIIEKRKDSHEKDTYEKRKIYQSSFSRIAQKFCIKK